MKPIIPTSKECTEFILRAKETIRLVTSKLKGLPQGRIKSGTYSKFQKATFIFAMDYGGLKRYVTDEQVWYDDPQIPKSSLSEGAREDVIDNFFRGKPSGFFLMIFSIFEDAIIRILEALDEDPDRIQRLDFEKKIQELKKKKLLTKSDDRRFCRFCMHIRNTIHSNSFFRGNDTPMGEILGEGPFTFKKNKLVDFLSTNRLLRWSEELVKVFEIIANSDKKIDEIKDNALREDLP